MMTQEDFDLLSQYIDGELSQEENLQIKQRLLSDPEFNKEYRDILALQNNVRAVMPDFKDEPMSKELADLLNVEEQDNSNVRQLPVRNSWKQNLSIAASVVFVAVLGVFMLNNDHSQTGLQIQDKMFSSLKSNESWNDNGLELIIVQSYVDDENVLCREYFAQDSEHSEHGISCFNDGNWNKQAFELQYNQSGSQYVTASAAENAGVEAFLDSKNLKSLSDDEEAQKLRATK